MSMKIVFIIKVMPIKEEDEGNSGKNILALQMLKKSFKVWNICRLFTS